MVTSVYTPDDTPDEYVFTCDLDRRAGLSEINSAAVTITADEEHVIVSHELTNDGRAVFLTHPDAVNLAELVLRLVGDDEPEPLAAQPASTRDHDFTAALLLAWCAVVVAAVAVFT